MTEAYKGEFKDWLDVQEQFQMTEPEPDEVILADYDVPGYEGHAYVFYRKGDKYYIAEGSHCSCYGLEDQWEPEEYTREVFVEALRKGASAWTKDSFWSNVHVEALKRMGEM